MRPPFVGSHALRLILFLCLSISGLLAMGCAVTYGNDVDVQYFAATPESTEVAPLHVTRTSKVGILTQSEPIKSKLYHDTSSRDTLTTMPAPVALPESLDIFFAGNPPPFPYQSLGLIEVQGAKYTTHGEVFDRLKFEAIRRRADAITEVQRLSTQRETGVLFSEKSDEYAPVAMTAVAARYIDGRKPTTPLDSGVQERVKRSLTNESSSLGMELLFSFVILPIAIILALAVK